MISRSKLNDLIRRAEQLNINYQDFLDKENFKDNFVYAFLYSYGVENNTESLIQFCIDNNIHNMLELFNFCARDLFK